MKTFLCRAMPAVILMLLATVAGQDAMAGRLYGFYRPAGMEKLTDAAYTALQDTSGYVWVGTRSGLLKYDGSHVYRYQFSRDDVHSLCNNHVSSLLYCPDFGKMVVGTDTGVSVYDFCKDSFSTLEACGYLQVKALLRDAGMLYVCTAGGLLRFSMGEEGPHGGMVPDEGFSIDDHIACARKIGDRLYFGGYDCFYSYTPAEGTRRLSTGTVRKLVLDITADGEDPSVLWLGTEQGLIRYSLEDSSMETYLDNVPVKYFFRYSDSVLFIATDNGLFVKEGEAMAHYVHEAGNGNSLPDNVIWSLARGAGDNIFICTDYGMAMPRLSSHSVFTSIASVTGSKGGLNVRVMASDPRGRLYMGGMDGLVVRDVDGRARWYRSDSGAPGRRLSHNKVRDLLDDGTGMFIVSDGGLDRLDYSTGDIRHLDIMDPSGKYYSTWMYSLAEDASGRLWIGTYNGLLLVADKAGLLSGASGPYIADAQYGQNTVPSISGDAVMDVAMADSFGAAVSNGMVDFIGCSRAGDGRDPEISFVGLPEDRYATALAADGDTVWIGTSRGLFRLGQDAVAEPVEGLDMMIDAVAVDSAGRKLFAVSGTSLYIHDMSGGPWTHCPFGDIPLFCGLPSSGGTMLFGSADGWFEMDPDYVPATEGPADVAVTAFILDNENVEVGREYDGNVILPDSRALDTGITLRHDQNTFAMEYSAFDFSGRTGRFAYRMAGLDDGWQVTSDTRAVFINVPSGKYRFEVAIASADGRVPAASLSLPVTVRTVWYATAFAYVLYFLVFAGLCAWVFYYLRMRQQLRTEHEERVRALEAVEMKTEFLSNVSHEFKSPLSIILGFVGRMIASESDALRTRELDTVRQNAEKIHLLLDRMVRFNEDSSTSTLFIPSATSLGDFARTVYDRYAGAFGEKNISSRFEADEIGYIFMVDKVKMESALSNLLSNALKFTAPGGSVVMSVKTGEETEEMVYADISVSDTGCGIAPEDLPMIFRRYYRVPGSASADPGGSGIGLALVKETVDLHKGKLSVTSEPGKGSTFTIRLSTMKADSFVLRKDPGEHYSLHSLSNVWQHERKPIILIVEDNSDIRDFIAASLGKDYSFLTAEDGKRGLELLSTEKTDLVITDISMPGMDGLEMCREIRSSIKTAFLPIIVLTGKNDVKTETRSYEYADAFIAKPFDLDYLNNRIIQLLIRHENWLSKTREQKMLEPGAVEEGRSFDEELLQNVVDIVTRHLEDPSFSASVLCSESRYGSKQIYRRIKQLTGLGIVEFIRDIRLRKAALYLSQGKFTVSEVMYKVGFTTASYFSKCFKEKYGVSPSEYRGK